jgi:hypothetical protein
MTSISQGLRDPGSRGAKLGRLQHITRNKQISQRWKPVSLFPCVPAWGRTYSTCSGSKEGGQASHQWPMNALITEFDERGAVLAAQIVRVPSNLFHVSLCLSLTASPVLSYRSPVFYGSGGSEAGVKLCRGSDFPFVTSLMVGAPFRVAHTRKESRMVLSFLGDKKSALVLLNTDSGKVPTAVRTFLHQLVSRVNFSSQS